MVKVSVIIPNYNHACYLKQRIDSILKQTYQDFEIIILDDCSPDNSREVIETYRDNPKVSNIVFNEINSGSTFKQWQKGVMLAKGDFIWLAESDDWCEPTLLETLMEGLLANPNVGLAFCQSCYYYEPNIVKETTYYPFYANTENGRGFIQKYMLNGNNVVNASMAVWRKELFNRVNTEYTQFKFSGDWLFWVSLLQISDVFVSGKILNYFRNHNKDVSSRFYSTGNNFIENVRLYKVLHQRNIIDKSQLTTLVKRQYTIFLSVKHSVNRDNLPNIYRAFEEAMGLNEVTKTYYSLRQRLYLIKQALLPKPAH
ncbi:glycosyltransferase family A protein [Mucilaginibacter sp. PAMB04274]|uniref:glycosyltransferase family A protein n=1 Tax=Mucilaginibacter sp. PAMB04274 TaxID=3138568 RepID=UPI0031F6271E